MPIVDRPGAAETVFSDLRRLADWFGVPASLRGRTNQLRSVARRLGATAVPLLGRELRGADPVRRDVARETLAMLATTAARARVIDELRAVTCDGPADDVKAAALGLLAELGEHGAARFDDPRAMQRRSALALAARMHGAADVAATADLMIRQLEPDDIVQMFEVLADAAPDAAHRLATELDARLDAPGALRERVAAIIAAVPRTAEPTRRAPRPAQVAVLIDATARVVVIASRKVIGERRWRRWAVLVGAAGSIEDCLYEDDAPDAGTDPDTREARDARAACDGAPLIARLCADGYRVASTDVDHARAVIAAAARRAPDALGSSYYLGRDLLALGDAHRAPSRLARDPTPAIVARAIDLLAAGEPARARPARALRARARRGRRRHRRRRRGARGVLARRGRARRRARSARARDRGRPRARAPPLEPRRRAPPARRRERLLPRAAPLPRDERLAHRARRRSRAARARRLRRAHGRRARAHRAPARHAAAQPPPAQAQLERGEPPAAAAEGGQRKPLRTAEAEGGQRKPARGQPQREAECGSRCGKRKAAAESRTRSAAAGSGSRCGCRCR